MKDPIPPRPRVWGHMSWQHYLVAALGILGLIAAFVVPYVIL